MVALRRIVPACLLAVLTVLLGVPVAAGEEGVGRYVALGDSWAAGPFIPIQRVDPPGCARSTRNYPAVLSGRLGVAEYVDVSCSGAQTEHMTQPQPVPFGVNPPQFEALTEDTDLVTVTISGNDVGFGEMVRTCSRLSFTDPLGNPCQRQATAGGGDRHAEAVDEAAPLVAAVLADIEERSPEATVALVGYLRILPPQRGCWPVVPVAVGDVPYLDGIQRRLTEMLAEQADAADVVFVDAYAQSLGHDVCQPPGRKWVEGLVPTAPGWPVHPNATGMQQVASFTEAALSAVAA